MDFSIAVITLNNFSHQLKHTAITLHLSEIALSKANKGLEGGWLPLGCLSSVAEHWLLKPEALGSIPGGATFPFKPLPFQRSTDGGGPDCVVHVNDHYSIDMITIGLQTKEESCPSDSFIAVITLNNFSHQLMHTAITLHSVDYIQMEFVHYTLAADHPFLVLKC